ncbi:MAG: lytic transglycosylase domain-containing protein, partial [Solirubrobacterales bacterium]|nr:lytic transglycosylase domain-containing protein [Solirubrobacterales bacterium]
GAGAAGGAGGQAGAGAGKAGLQGRDAARQLGRAARAANRARGDDDERRESGRKLVQAAAFGAGLLVAMPLLLIVTVLVAMSSVFASSGANAATPGSAYPEGSGIPRVYWPIYVTAAGHYEVSAYLLASIHMQETGFSQAPSASAGFNDYGCCGGPMQFMPSTWEAYAKAFAPIDGQRPASYPLRREELPSCAGVPADTGCMYDDFDAIAGAAMMLAANGADLRLDSPGTREAVCAYIGDCAEVDECTGSINQYCGVIPRAKEWERTAMPTPAPTSNYLTPFVPGTKAVLLPDGYAAAPMDAPREVQQMVHAANQINHLPYEMVHYPTHLNNPTYDCSSSTSNVLYHGGKFGKAPMCSANYVTYGDPGPGRWVTVYARGPCGSTGHVFMVIAGLRFDTSGGGDSGPNAGEGGPRWRTGRVDLGTFTARHPEGL